MADLSELFAEQQSNVIDLGGTPTYGLIEFDDVPAQIRLTLVAAKGNPSQGVQLRIRRGTLLINGHELTDAVLWHDSAPSNVIIDIRATGRAKPELKLWNVWRGGLDVTQAWLGNSAIQIEGDPASGSFRLHCSDGQGEPDFSDLVVEVETS